MRRLEIVAFRTALGSVAMQNPDQTGQALACSLRLRTPLLAEDLPQPRELDLGCHLTLDLLLRWAMAADFPWFMRL